MNSANVAGGFAPAPLHSIRLEPQSPVAQMPSPVVGSNEQPVLPQNRPDHPGWAWIEMVAPGGSWKPVMEAAALDSIPGHTV